MGSSLLLSAAGPAVTKADGMHLLAAVVIPIIAAFIIISVASCLWCFLRKRRAQAKLRTSTCAGAGTDIEMLAAAKAGSGRVNVRDTWFSITRPERARAQRAPEGDEGPYAQPPTGQVGVAGIPDIWMNNSQTRLEAAPRFKPARLPSSIRQA
jgi:membrane protein implicated in regulation of membrane protease activity